MLQVEVVGGAPGGAVVAVEPAQAQEAWTSILESQRWLEIRAGYGQDPSGFIVRLRTNVEEIPPSRVVFWMKATIPDEPEPVWNGGCAAEKEGGQALESLAAFAAEAPTERDHSTGALARATRSAHSIRGTPGFRARPTRSLGESGPSFSMR